MRLTETEPLLRIIRPHIVAGGFLGYSLGTLLALNMGGKFSPITFILGYMTVLLGDLSTHFSNDYYDADLDGKAENKTFGGSSLLAHRPELRPAAIHIATALSAASIAIGLLTTAAFNYPPLLPAIVVAANLLGWLYSAPPIKLGSRGLGETIIALGTGLAIPAVGYLTILGALDGPFLAFSAPLAAYGFILGLSLEAPDLEADRGYGRKNVVVLAGRRRGAILALVLAIVAEGCIILFVELYSRYYALPVLSAVPLVTAARSVYSRHDDRPRAVRSSANVIASLFFFLVASDIYLLSSLL